MQVQVLHAEPQGSWNVAAARTKLSSVDNTAGALPPQI
jgi:hypothetical protein